MTASTGYTFNSGTITIGTQSAKTITTPTSTHTICGDATITAEWTAQKYTVTLDPQGGTGGTASVQATYDADMPRATMPTRTGYTFGGYWTEKEGKGTQYYNADGTSTKKWNIASATTLFAKWTANKYTVKFNANGGSGSMMDQPFIYDVAQNLTANAFTRTGYTFAGWNTKDDGTGESYTNEQEVQNLTADNNGTINLYAQWNEKLSTITITTNPAEGGRVEVDGLPFTPGNTVQVGVTTTKQVTTIPNEGYGVTSWEFKGAAEWQGGQNTVTLASDGSGEDGELIANYIPLSRNINFDKQSGEGGTDAATVTYTQNDYSPTSVVAPTRSGYTFGGYYSEANGAGVQIVSAVGEWLSNASGYTDANGNWLKSAENTTLYAQWTAKTYTVTLDQTEAKVEGTTIVTATYDEAMPSATMPTAANGYVFMGYFDGEQVHNTIMRTVRARTYGIRRKMLPSMRTS